MTVTLDTLDAGQDGTITLLDVSHDLLLRLTALGVQTGKTVKMIRRARFTGPIHIRVDTTELMIRRHEARCIQLMPHLTN